MLWKTDEDELLGAKSAIINSIQAYDMLQEKIEFLQLQESPLVDDSAAEEEVVGNA